MPRAGGILDQPLWLLEEMETTLTVYDALKARERGFKQSGANEWTKHNKELANYCNALDEEVAEAG